MRKGQFIAIVLSVMMFIVLTDSNGYAMPNPASVFCKKMGGMGFNADEGKFGGNQYGLCRLQDNSLIIEWTLHRGFVPYDSFWT